MKNILIFGATGSIGKYIYNSFTKLNSDEYPYHVYGTTSQKIHIIPGFIEDTEKYIHVDNDNLDNLRNINNIDIIVWCQGSNANDNIFTFSEKEYMHIMNTNVLFIIKTLNFLLKYNKINNNGKMVIISSIWQELARENKLSYTISKSALSGLVKNLSYDLSKYNILINNVLPGVIDNEMSRKTLSEEQFNYIKKYLFFDRFVNVDDIFQAVRFLCVENSGITGESIKVDLGFSNTRKYD